MARVRLEADAVADDPGLLSDEAHAVPMFGGPRVIQIRVGARAIDAAVAAVLDAPPVDAWIVLTAGELRKTAPLRRLCESHACAAAVACYADADRDLDRVIDRETADAGLTIADDARAALRALLGADRRVSRAEVAKLCLYAAGSGTITVDDVRAATGDAAAFAIDETVDLVALGDASGLDRGYRRLLAAGTPGFVVAGAALRHFNFLETARAAYDDGAAPAAIMARARPPVFRQRQARVASAIERWPPARIARALSILDQAMLDSRLHGAISDAVVGQALHLVAALAPARLRT